MVSRTLSDSSWSGLYDSANGAPGVRAVDVAAIKASLGAREAVLSGVLANALVCLAVWLSLSARSVADKVVAVVFPVTGNIVGGALLVGLVCWFVYRRHTKGEPPSGTSACANPDTWGERTDRPHFGV